jgi:hypothetical protein
MLRAFMCLIPIVIGASAVAWSMEILRQLEAALGEGSGLAGTIRVFVVAISPSKQAQVDCYRWQAEVLLIAGLVLLVSGMLIGMGSAWRAEGMAKRAKRKPQDGKRSDRAAG